MSPYRSALWGGLLYGIPLGLWLIGSALVNRETVGDSALATLTLTQTVTVALLLPTLAGANWLPGLMAATLLVATPWPLLVVLIEANITEPRLAIISQGLVCLFAWTLVGLWHRIRHLPDQGWRMTLAGALQILALLAVLLVTPLTGRLTA